MRHPGAREKHSAASRDRKEREVGRQALNGRQAGSGPSSNRVGLLDAAIVARNPWAAVDRDDLQLAPLVMRVTPNQQAASSGVTHEIRSQLGHYHGHPTARGLVQFSLEPQLQCSSTRIRNFRQVRDVNVNMRYHVTVPSRSRATHRECTGRCTNERRYSSCDASGKNLGARSILEASRLRFLRTSVQARCAI